MHNTIMYKVVMGYAGYNTHSIQNLLCSLLRLIGEHPGGNWTFFSISYIESDEPIVKQNTKMEGARNESNVFMKNNYL